MTIFDWFSLALRSVLAYVFIAYGVEKLFRTKSFTATIRGYHVVPEGASPILARTLPSLEVGLGTLLLFNIAPVTVAIALALLLLVFSAVLLKQGLNKKDCGCRGSKPTSPRKALVRNLVLLLLSGATIALSSLISPTTDSVLVVAEAVVLAAILVLTLAAQRAWASRLAHHLQHTTTIKAASKAENGSANLSTRRSFVRGAGAFGLGLLVVSIFRTANVAFADRPTCSCNYASPCKVLRQPSDCSCCQKCNPGGWCWGSTQTWYIYCCQDKIGVDCDANYVLETTYCLCA